MIKDGKYYCDKCGKEIPAPFENNFAEDLYFGIKEDDNIVHAGKVSIDLCINCADDIFYKILECFDEEQKEKLIKEVQKKVSDYAYNSFWEGASTINLI